jgi:hypothetical protein
MVKQGRALQLKSASLFFFFGENESLLCRSLVTEYYFLDHLFLPASFYYSLIPFPCKISHNSVKEIVTQDMSF